MRYTFLFLGLLTACATPGTKTGVTEKTDIVFLHGSHFDASSWDRVRGHMPIDRRTTMLNIPHRTLAPVLALKQAAQRACHETPRPSIFVAHSFAGAIVHQMVSVCPEKIKQIIYVAAVVVLPGERTVQTFSAQDQENYAQAVDLSEEWMAPKERDQFFAIMAGPKYEADPAWPPLYRESSKMAEEKLEFDVTVWKNIPKGYIFTRDDLVMSRESQERFAQKAQAQKTHAIYAGHLPMLTHPEYLADAIRDLASE